MVKKNKSNLNISAIIIAVLVLIIVVLLGIILFKGNGKDKKKTTKTNKNESILERLSIKEAPAEDYEILYTNTEPIFQNIAINQNDVDYHAMYYSTIIDKVYKIDDYYIIVILALYTDQSTTYDSILYAIDKKGNVLWFTSEKSACERSNTELCKGLTGQSTTSEFNYTDRSYDIKDDTITFATRIPTHNLYLTLCNMDANEEFAAEYQIKYKGKNKFSDIKKINSITAGKYLENLKANGSEVNCSEYKY